MRLGISMPGLMHLGLPIVLGLVCFYPVLFADRQFGFRDSGDFYYPLYLRVQQDWQAGRIPLWESEENGGMPLLGNPTAAVLYPGKLIYALFPYPWAARLYVVAHVALSFVGMSIMLRGWDVSRTGASLAAMSYAFGAPTLLQYCNVIFLVGAAWMPLGLYLGCLWLRSRRSIHLAWLSLVLAMQFLGGDPEAAYLTVVATAAYAVCVGSRRLRLGALRSGGVILLALVAAYTFLLAWKVWCEPLGQTMGVARRPGAERVSLLAWILVGAMLSVRWWRRRDNRSAETGLLGLAGAGLLAMAISAAQLLPCLEFIRLSLRSSEQATSIIYDYSIHPARLFEGLWPNVFGVITPGNGRWLGALPPTHDFQVWVDSLYPGGLALYLGVSAGRARFRSCRRSWLTWLVIGALLASMGTYGSPLFWGRSIPSLTGVLGNHNSNQIGNNDPGSPYDGDGGVYWFLATLLPGFRSFRYPGKLLIPAHLGLCALAGIGWDRLARGELRRLRTLALAGLTLALTGLTVISAPLSRSLFASYLKAHQDDATTVFGPLNLDDALSDSRSAFVQGVAVAGVALLASFLVRRAPRLASSLVLSVSALDLGIANARLIHTVPQCVLESVPRALELIEQAETGDPSPGPYRIHRMPNWSPANWLAASSPRRGEDIVRWERESLRPKYAIPYGASYVYSMGTTELLDLVLFFDSFLVPLDSETRQRFGIPADQKLVYFTRRGFDLWNARYFILPARLALGSRHRGVLSFLPRTLEIDPPPGIYEGPGGEARRRRHLYEEDVQVLRNEAVFPRSWIVHRARFVRPIAGMNLDDRRELMNEILYQDDELWHVDGRKVLDPRDLAWVEVDSRDRSRIARGLSGKSHDPTESVTVDVLSPQRVVLTARLRSAGLVVLSDALYPGWQLTIDGKPSEIIRTNRAMRGAMVPSGVHQLVYKYAPRSVQYGTALSVLGIAGCVFLILGRERARFKGPSIP